MDLVEEGVTLSKLGHGEAGQVDVDQDQEQDQDQDQDLYLPEQKSPSCRDSLPPTALGSSSWHSPS